jgi:hypothetical protein
VSRVTDANDVIQLGSVDLVRRATFLKTIRSSGVRCESAEQEIDDVDTYPSSRSCTSAHHCLWRDGHPSADSKADVETTREHADFLREW